MGNKSQQKHEDGKQFLGFIHVSRQKVSNAGTSCIVYCEMTQELFVSNYDGDVFQIHTKDLTILKTLKNKNEKISKLLFLPDGNLISHGKGHFTIWNLKTYKKIIDFCPNRNWVRSATLFENGSKILTAGSSSDGIYKFNIDDLYKQNTIPTGHLNLTNQWIYTIANIDDKYYGYCIGSNLFIRDLNDDTVIAEILSRSFQTNLCSLYIEKHSVLILGNYDGYLVFVDVNTWEIVQQVDLHQPIPSIVLLPNDLVAASHYKGGISIVGMNFEILTVLINEGPLTDIDDMAVVENKYLVCCDDSGYLNVWKIPFFVPLDNIAMLKKEKCLDIKFLFV